MVLLCAQCLVQQGTHLQGHVEEHHGGHVGRQLARQHVAHASWGAVGGGLSTHNM